MAVVTLYFPARWRFSLRSSMGRQIVEAAEKTRSHVQLLLSLLRVGSLATASSNHCRRHFTVDGSFRFTIVRPTNRLTYHPEAPSTVLCLPLLLHLFSAFNQIFQFLCCKAEVK